MVLSPDPVLRVALPVPLPRLFDYAAPADDPAGPGWVGCRVRVPFGRGEKVGVVVAAGPMAVDAPNLKPVLERLDQQPLLTGELFASLDWAARYYQSPLGDVLAVALPTRLRAGGSATVRPRRRATAAAGADEYAGKIHEIAPNAEQRHAIELLRGGHGFRTVLLDGVTGSGKTEVYLQAIADCLANHRQALVLVPEIGLTPQTLQRFRSRLGVAVHALHSGLAEGERARSWLAMARGEGRVLVGTRSAVFCPLPEAGLIVIDEEHDGSYKQHEGLRYSARDLALVRAKALAVPIILGSATPSLESLHNARTGRYQHVRLSQRAGGARAPTVRVLDLRKRRLDHGLCDEVFASIERCLARGEQALVFKNRRGYAPVLLCHDCGWSAGCKRCSTPLQRTPMTVHGSGRGLRCHHCGATGQRPLSCPDCASLALQPQGAGTERLEAVLAERFPEATLVRIDSDNTRIRDGLQKKLDEIGDGPGIIVGTQMLAKGHDLPRLTLVVVVGIDEGLFSADFRAGEKLAQLLIQVSGRAGRAQRPGEVLLQTHHPEHPLLSTLLAGGYAAAADLALAERAAAELPPYAFLALLRAEANHEAAVQTFLDDARNCLDAARLASGQLDASPPMPAPMPRRAGKSRWQLLLSARQRPALQAALGQWLPQLYALPSARKVRWSVDVDPLDLY